MKEAQAHYYDPHFIYHRREPMLMPHTRIDTPTRRPKRKHTQDVIHPNICRLLGVSTDGPKRCLILEMCPAGALYGVLKADRAKLAAGGSPALGWRARHAWGRRRRRARESVDRLAKR